jgi:hypothetical protein
MTRADKAALLFSNHCKRPAGRRATINGSNRRAFEAEHVA